MGNFQLVRLLGLLSSFLVWWVLEMILEAEWPLLDLPLLEEEGWLLLLEEWLLLLEGWVEAVPGYVEALVARLP